MLSFEDWWADASVSANGEARQGLNSIIILGAWSLWTHRNRCVFDSTSPSLRSILATTGDELKLWVLAGARGIGRLLALEEG